MSEMMKIILSMSLSGTMLILVLRLAKPQYRNKLSKQWQYYIWIVVIARLLLPFTPSESITGNLFQSSPTSNSGIENSSSQDSILENTGFFSQTANSSDEKNASQNAASHSNTLSPNADGSGVSSASESAVIQGLFRLLVRHLGLIWSFGAFMLIIRKITVYQSFARYIAAGRTEVTDLKIWEQLGMLMEQAGVRRPVSLYINKLVSSPLLLGFCKPCIILPSENLTCEEFEFTVLHELTHYKRLDQLFKWLVQITVCLHWFNPAVWYMAREINKACELSCDEAVIQRLDTEGRRAYGTTLIEAMKTGGIYQGGPAALGLNQSIALLKERLDAIMNFKKKTPLAIVLTLSLTAAVCLGAAKAGAYASPGHNGQKESESMQPGQSSSIPDSSQDTETPGFVSNTQNKKVRSFSSNARDGEVLSIPVSIEEIGEGEYIWLGEYSLAAGDQIRYDIPDITGEHITVGFARPDELSPVYFSQRNDKSHGILKVAGTFEVPDALAGNYRLFLLADNGPLADINGTIEISSSPDTNTSGNQDVTTDQDVITIPLDYETVESGTWLWLGEYNLAYGDKLRYQVSAAGGSGLKIGLAVPGEDPADRTYYTASLMRYNDKMEMSMEIEFAEPVKPGRYRLFLCATGSDDLTGLEGEITIAMQNSLFSGLESVTIKNKTYYSICSKEQLLGLTDGQLPLDKNYLLQYDIDLTGLEWIPIGTEENPFTGSFSGNGCEIQGLTMTDPDAEVIGMFGYARDANIYNITLRDYDITAAGSNLESKSISPVLVFGTNTRCYDNHVYPKQ